MWTYSQSNGNLMHNGELQTVGYSGTGAGRNNPAMENAQAIGPIPKGFYDIGIAYDDPHLGPCVMRLDPGPNTNEFGRSLFRIHGNNAKNDASHGCIILGPNTRHQIAGSDDHELEVIE